MFGSPRTATELSDPVRRSLLLARKETLRLGHASVDTEHLLLGLLRTGSSSVERLLERLGTTDAELRAAVESLAPPPAAKPARRVNEPEYTRGAKGVVERMTKLAESAGSAEVTPAHLLLSLLDSRSGVAAEALRKAGITEERIRAAAAAADADEARGVQVEIDDESEQSIFAQIVAQVQENIATGALRPGDRLQPVRRLADLLDVAPGTVARAYRELERMGVVVTEGARGTRVAQRREGVGNAPAAAENLVVLLRPAAVAAFHRGATADELRAALEEAMRDIFRT